MADSHEPIALEAEAENVRIMATAAAAIIKDGPLTEAEDYTLKALAEAYGEIEARAEDLQRSVVEVIADRRAQRAEDGDNGG